MKLEIILRTCDCKNVSQYSRFISVSKEELILGCVASPLSLHMQGNLQEDPYINWRE